MVVVALCGLGLAGCSPASQPAAQPPGTPGSDDDAPLPPPANENGLPEGVRAVLSKPFTGDLDAIAARRLIRVGVTYNRTFYFIDNGVQRGAAYEFGNAFEDQLNAKLKTGNAKINVVFMPMSRDALASALIDGKIDFVMAQVTIRPELQALVDFTNATRTNVNEVVVTLRFMIDRYFKDEPMDQLNKGLFAFASYNAGPGRIRQLRKETEKRGLNPNIWFGNVEQIASERVGRETVTYVSNIYKYYVAYKLIAEQREQREAAKATLKSGVK